MTKAQKENQARFKKVQAEAKKLKAKNPRLAHTEAVKKAWAMILPKSGKKVSAVKKKPAAKVKTSVKRKASIAGVFKFAGAGFQDVRQFDIYGDLSYIIEDKYGKKLTEITANPKNNDIAYKKIYAYILRDTDGYILEADKSLETKIKKFVKQLQTEAAEYNKGKKSTAKPAKQFIPAAAAKAPAKKKVAAKAKPATRKAAAKKQTGRTNIAIDKKIQAKAPGKRVSKSGNVYYEARANRSDKGRLLGVKKPAVSKHKDTNSHNVNIKVMSGVGKIKIGNIPQYQDKDAAREIQLFADNDYQLYQSQRLPILKNLARKYQKGTFKIDRAADLWKYYVDNAMKKYHKLYGSPRGNWYDLLSMQDRKRLALDYAVETFKEFSQGNFEF